MFPHPAEGVIGPAKEPGGRDLTHSGRAGIVFPFGVRSTMFAYGGKSLLRGLGDGATCSLPPGGSGEKFFLVKGSPLEGGEHESPL